MIFLKQLYNVLPGVLSSFLLLIFLLFSESVLPVLAEPPASQPVPTFITIATGPLNGLYYPAGRSICQILNGDGGFQPLLCSVERTSGSIYNLKALEAGVVEFCISQSDQLSAAYAGTGEFKDSLDDLRIVSPLFEESFTVVVRADSSIHRISDLKQRVISSGLPGSGGYATLRVIIKSLGWDFSDIMKVDTISNAKALVQLCDKRLDAVAFTAGHPYPPLEKAAEKCNLRLLRVRGAAISRLLATSPAYSRTVIPGGLYSGIDKPVKTIGVVATLVSSNRVNSELVYRVLKSLNEQMAVFRQAHPVFGSVTIEEMLREQRAAPMHAGAERYWSEMGNVVREHRQDDAQ